MKRKQGKMSPYTLFCIVFNIPLSLHLHLACCLPLSPPPPATIMRPKTKGKCRKKRVKCSRVPFMFGRLGKTKRGESYKCQSFMILLNYMWWCSSSVASLMNNLSLHLHCIFWVAFCLLYFPIVPRQRSYPLFALVVYTLVSLSLMSFPSVPKQDYLMNPSSDLLMLPFTSESQQVTIAFHNFGSALFLSHRLLAFLSVP